MKPYLIVVGSSNTDMVAKTERLPAAGETVLSSAFMMAAGGKGANQAVAAARLGAEVVFIARVGEDIFGKQAIASFRQEGIDTDFISIDEEHPSGVALITVDATAENCIVVASGANAHLAPGDVHKASDKIKKASLILMQLEIPIDTVEYVAGLAEANNIPLVLNPAPALVLSDALLKKISVITPNQQEAEMLTGITIIDKSSAEQSARTLAARGPHSVIITLAAQGALLLHKNKFDWIPAPKVIAVDTTAAGDVFSAALAVGLLEGKEIKSAAEFACAAAALSVTKMGAQTSAPKRTEADAFFLHNKL
ncbi:MAG TPA: ribokinase [Puia sp.]|nr:ribokinase [Puia sp.]